MRLIEAIIDANHRALAGDADAGLHPADFESELPLVALTCVDPRLNALLPSVLGVPPEQFIWLRNAGNVISGPVSSTMRSLALALAIKGGKEIAIIGHTDCQVGKTTTMELIDRLRAMGVERRLLPDNINEYFGLFGSFRQNVLKAAELVRSSPLIGAKIPVHGLLVDIQTGKLEWLVNGYQVLETATSPLNEVVRSAGQTIDALKSLAEFKIGEMKFPESKIGDTVTKAEEWFSQHARHLEIKPSTPPVAPSPPAPPPKIPLPPPIRPRMTLRRGPK
ncbi:MAG TPA: carbonic anhydrase [Candidatus Binatia bacterium]|jgi:carbonic anhydrase|nr:carbonic anhydrase [Candidatus Binatia bacterium]